MRRIDEKEKFCVIFKQNLGHSCEYTYTVVTIVVWEAFPVQQVNDIYRFLTSTLPKYGNPTPRKCSANDSKSCACQGTNPETKGASYSFGCSWAVYYNGCKFARSKEPRKFRLKDASEREKDLEAVLQGLANKVAPLYKNLAPKAYANQIQTQEDGAECRLGFGEEKPFSGVTCCMDFSAHSHHDRYNMHDGSTILCTILKAGVTGTESNPEDEQFHVLPLYRLKHTPERSTPGIEVRDPCLLYTSPSPRDRQKSRMPSSA